MKLSKDAMLQLKDPWNNNVFGVECIGSRSMISMQCQTSKNHSLHKCLGTGPYLHSLAKESWQKFGGMGALTGQKFGLWAVISI